MTISKTLNHIIQAVETEGADVINVPTAYIYRMEAEIKDEFIHQYNMVNKLLKRVVSLQEQVKAAYLEGWSDGEGAYSPYTDDSDVNYNSSGHRDEMAWDESKAKANLFARDADADGHITDTMITSTVTKL